MRVKIIEYKLQVIKNENRQLISTSQKTLT